MAGREGAGEDQELVGALSSRMRDVSIVVCKPLEYNLEKENNYLLARAITVFLSFFFKFFIL